MHNSRFIVLYDRTDLTGVIRLHLPLRLGGTIAANDPAAHGFHARRGFEKLGL